MGKKYQIHLLFLLIILAFFFIPFAAAEENKIYEATIVVDKGEINIEQLQVKTGNIPNLPGTGKFRYEVIGFNNESLFAKDFDIKQSIILKMPYFKKGNIILFYKDFIEIDRVNVARFADVCGNNICEYIESYGDCPEDCSSGMKDNYCDGKKDRRCDPDCKDPASDQDCVRKGTPWYVYVIIIIVLILLIFIYNYKLKDKFKAKKKPSKASEELGKIKEDFINAEKALLHKDLKEAKKSYVDALGQYKKLSTEEQRKAHKFIKTLHKHIKKIVEKVMGK